MESSNWAVDDQAVHHPEDDFQQFLDMNGMGNMSDGINYNFQEFQSSAGSQLLQQHAREQIDIPMTGADAPILPSPAASTMQHHMSTLTTAAPHQGVPVSMMPPPTPNEAIVDSIDAQIQFLQQQKLRHQQRHIEEQQAAFFARQQNGMVPPTPQSLELRPGPDHYYSQSSGSEQQQQQQQQQQPPQHQHQQQAMEYRYQRMKDQQDMSFTPLVSPAVTPLDTHFSVDSQFGVSGAYFSPLTSPALHAQTDPLAMFDQMHNMANTNSSTDLDMDSSAAPPTSNTATGDPVKKARKNAAKARTKTGIKQSPISKPLRRRTTTTPSLNAQVLSELAENIESPQDSQLLPTPMMQSSSSTTGMTDSEDSVSPETLNDTTTVEMPPPPVPQPRSAKPSPSIAPQANAVAGTLQSRRPGLASPATPASLMKLNSPSTRNAGRRSDSQEAVDTDHIETFELPESANFLNKAATSTNDRTTGQSPQEADISSKPSSLTSSSSPSVLKLPATPANTMQSPQLLAGPGAGPKKTPQLLPRGGKKRGSVSSIPVSPALRPRISPNIKPLLPGGPDVEEAASHLLATKSNYQRILEGNTLPGVSYPSELSTNLTSKRTSHKIAEQGRRNRINSALQEIASLLPRPPAKDSEGEGGDGKKDKGGVPSSKASTVEMAIEYIKQLKKEVAEANRRAEEAEKKLEMKSGAKASEEKETA